MPQFINILKNDLSLIGPRPLYMEYNNFLSDKHKMRMNIKPGLTGYSQIKLFDQKDWNKLHLQIIFYGREFCEARKCYGLECKICTACNPGRKKPIKTKKA